jgi:outer membrane immunogenic protein
MRKLILATVFAAFAVPAFSADLPRKAPAYAPPPPPPFSWTGIYIGGDIGYGWGKSDGLSTNAAGLFPTPYSFNPNGVIGGGFIGANYQFNQFVIGVEADWQAADLDGAQDIPAIGGSIHVSTKVNDYGSLRGRLGFAWDRFLIFGTGGWAWGNGHTFYGVTGAPPAVTRNINSSGWTAGAGVEYAFTNNWLARLEYRYTDLGTQSYVDPATNSADTGNPVTINDIRLGLAYKFW